MIKITVTMPSGRKSFTHECVEVEEAKRLLDMLRVHGFEAAQHSVQRTGRCREHGHTFTGGKCRDCDAPDPTARR